MSNTNKLLGVGLLVGGIILAVRAKQSGPLNGFDGFGSSFKKAAKSVKKSVSKVTDNKILRPVLAVATAGTSELTRKSVNFSVDPSKELKKLNPMNVLAKSPVFSKTLLFRRFAGGKPSASGEATAAPEQTTYTDAAGNVITQAEYNAIMAVASKVMPPLTGPHLNGAYQDSMGQIISASEYQLWLRAGGSTAIAVPNMPSAPVVSDPYGAGSGGGSGSGTSYTSIVTPTGEAPNDPDYQDASQAFSDGAQQTLLPGAAEAPTEQQYAALPATEAPKKKLNPFVIGGVLLAVPVLMGMGGK